MMNQEIKDFIILPRKIRDDYANGKLTKNEFDVLVWIWLNTNPYNGFYLMSYEGLRQDLHKIISYDNARKIISSLRKEQYIYFLNHRGRKGSFPVYPIGFLLTNGQIQTLDYLKKKSKITSQSQSKEQRETKLENSLRGAYHNFNAKKEALIRQFSMNNQNSKITNPYNDNNKNNKYIDNFNNSFNKSASSYKEKVIPVEDFFPQTYEEEQCWKIAKSLGETDMRFLLSCLKKYGLSHIERAWGIFKERPKEKIQNPRNYFNKIIRKLAE